MVRDSAQKRIIPIFWDVDLTITEQYQQVPLFSQRFAQIKKVVAKEGFSFSEEMDYFARVDKTRSELAIGYLQQMVWDAQKGGALEGLSNAELFQTGLLVKPAKGFIQLLRSLKKEFDAQDVELHHFFISVGIRPIIEGFVEKHRIKTYVKGIASGEFLEKNGRIVGIKKIVYPFSKNEHIISFMKGSYELLNKQLKGSEYKYDYEDMIVIGDGFTDTSKFAYAKKKGGTPVAVYKSGDEIAFLKAKETVGSWVDFILPRDYTPGGITHTYIREIISKKLKRKSTFPPMLLHDYKKGNIVHKKLRAFIKQELDSTTELHDFFKTVHVGPDGKVVESCIYRI